MSAARRPASRTLEEAADWLVRIDAGDLDEAGDRQLTLWRQQSREHEQAWQAACRLKSMLGAVPPELGASALDRPRTARRTLLKSLAALATVPSVSRG